MRRLAILALAALLSCGGDGDDLPPGVDQKAVDACYLSIGVAVPIRDSELGSINGWLQVAETAVQSSNHRIEQIGRDLQAALSPDVQKGGIDDAEQKRYHDAAIAWEQACKELKAFSASPFQS